MSEQELERLLENLRAERAVIRATPDSEPLYTGKTTWIEDHGMALYLEKIRGVTREREAIP